MTPNSLLSILALRPTATESLLTFAFAYVPTTVEATLSKALVLRPTAIACSERFISDQGPTLVAS